MPDCLEEMNDLESPENCRGAGRHGNQHVCLRRAQVGSTPRSARPRHQLAAWAGQRAILDILIGDCETRLRRLRVYSCDLSGETEEFQA